MPAGGCGDLRDVRELACVPDVAVINEDLGFWRTDLEAERTVAEWRRRRKVL
jgi:hypothetical protein